MSIQDYMMWFKFWRICYSYRNLLSKDICNTSYSTRFCTSKLCYVISISKIYPLPRINIRVVFNIQCAFHETIKLLDIAKISMFYTVKMNDLQRFPTFLPTAFLTKRSEQS